MILPRSGEDFWAQTRAQISIKYGVTLALGASLVRKGANRVQEQPSPPRRKAQINRLRSRLAASLAFGCPDGGEFAAIPVFMGSQTRLVRSIFQQDIPSATCCRREM